MIEALIRPMEPRDIQAVFALEQACFSLPWSREALEKELENSIARYLVAEHGGKLIAYCGMWLIIDEAHITNIAVEEAYRKQAVGTKLLCAAQDLARKEGMRSMTLEVRESNAPAIGLYEKLGFQAYGLRKKYYPDNGENALIMWNNSLADVEAH